MHNFPGGSLTSNRKLPSLIKEYVHNLQFEKKTVVVEGMQNRPRSAGSSWTN